MLTLSPIPKRIAVLSVETSKGFQDFKKVIDQSTYSIEIELLVSFKTEFVAFALFNLKA